MFVLREPTPGVRVVVPLVLDTSGFLASCSFTVYFTKTDRRESHLGTSSELNAFN